MMGLAFCLILAGCLLIGNTGTSVLVAGALIFAGGLLVMVKT